MASDELLSASGVILDSLGDGVYVCDKDGHQLCGEEFCPLHRAMVTGATSTVPIIVFARGKEGRRIPMEVTVAPIRDAAGEVVGGVETFRDVSAALADLERAKRIQTLSLEENLPEDPRIRFSTCYRPHDIVGGEYLTAGERREQVGQRDPQQLGQPRRRNRRRLRCCQGTRDPGGRRSWPARGRRRLRKGLPRPETFRRRNRDRSAVTSPLTPRSRSAGGICQGQF